MRKRMTIALILSSISFAIALCFFLIGFLFCYQNIEAGRIFGLTFVAISFPIGIISIIFITRCKSQIEDVLIYGLPIYSVSDKIVEIINGSTKFGIEKLHEILDAAIKEEINKVVDGNNVTQGDNKK